jgi:urea transporter
VSSVDEKCLVGFGKHDLAGLNDTRLGILFRIFGTSATLCLTMMSRATVVPMRCLVSKNRICYRMPRFQDANTFRSCRFFSGKPDSDQPATTPPPQPPLSPSSLWTSSSTGVGQVIFLHSETSGIIILASLAVGDPFLAGLAALGSLSATAMAHVAQLDLKQPSNSDNNDNQQQQHQQQQQQGGAMIRAGLYSYNGCLVGCAASVFLAGGGGGDNIVAPLAFTVLGGASSTMVTAALSRATAPMPQWTWAFNVVTLTALLHAQPLKSSVLLDQATVTSTTAILEPISTQLPGMVAAFNDWLVMAPVRGLSQIFVVESTMTGLGIVVALAQYSPALARYGLLGGSAGAISALVLFNAPFADVNAGLYSFNAALTSLGVAVFFVETRESFALAMGGAIASTAVFAALQPVFAMAGSPCLTLPFCLTMSACWALRSRASTGAGDSAPLVPGLILAANPHSPEMNCAT